MKHLIALCAFVFSMAAHAADGNTLFKYLSEEPNFAKGYAMGFVIATSHAFDEKTHCIPENVTNGQTIDVVRNFLSNNPQMRHRNGQALIVLALNQAFPCKKGNPL